METIVRSANVQDTSRLISFLEGANLGVEGVEQAIEYFLILEDDKGNINATVGIEPLGRIGLLRSLVMTSNTSEKDLMMIFEQMLILARDKRLTSVYLATNKQSSLPFFSMMGFIKEEKDQLPEELFQSEHAKQILTVDNSLFMKLNM